MTTDDVKERIAKIVADEGDDESQHAAEDSLHQAVLEAIAFHKCDNPADLAALALTTRELNFERWCA